MVSSMWSNIPFDLLAKIFSFLSPDSLACARSTCRNWHRCSNTYPLTNLHPQNHKPWFLALPTRNYGQSCYVHNPVTGNWHLLSLDFLPVPVRPVSSIGCLILLRSTNSTVLQLSVCNPFSRKIRELPLLNVTRTNPAVGIVTANSGQNGNFTPSYKIYVAGGMSDAPRGGAMYESTMEMYNSREDTWQIVGSMPTEFAVRLTVWTPNERVYINGVIYWMTSARAYSVIAVEIESNRWWELRVPLADKLEFAALVRRGEKLTVVGGAYGGNGCIWELDEGGSWILVENVPVELGVKLLGGNKSWGSTKCVGSYGAIWLYREIGSGMVVWKQVEGKWEWAWVEGCSFVRAQVVPNLAIKGLLLHPNLHS